MVETLPEVPGLLTVTFRSGELVELGRTELDRFNDADVRLQAAREATQTLPSFHHQGEGGQRRGARVDLRAVKVVGEDQPGNLAGRVTFFFVDRVEQVESVGEHVARAASGVADRIKLNTTPCGAGMARLMRNWHVTWGNARS